VMGSILDNSNLAAATLTPGWTKGGLPGGFDGGYVLAGPLQGPRAATWVETGLAPGLYDLYATWVASGNRAPNAPYPVLDDGDSLEVVKVDQRKAPQGDTADGQTWQLLGHYIITTGKMTVTLTNQANGVVVADAIRVVPTRSVDDGDLSSSLNGNWAKGGI